jgi:putative transposase
MSAHQAVFPIAVMARVLGVSEAGCHAWRHRQPSAHAIADAALLKRIRTIHASSRARYGAPRVHAELPAGGEKHGRKRIARLMRTAGLAGARRRGGTVVTTRRARDPRPAPDLVDRNFVTSRPNQLWVADITFVPTASGFLYLAVVLDACSRKIVGWSRANHLRAELVLDALEMAIGQFELPALRAALDGGRLVCCRRGGLAERSAGPRWRNSFASSSVQNPITRSTPTRLYQLRSKITISPAAGRCGMYRWTYI